MAIKIDQKLNKLLEAASKIESATTIAKLREIVQLLLDKAYSDEKEKEKEKIK